MKPSEKPEVRTDEQLIAAPITIYADQLAQLAIGPFASKLTFGVDRKQGDVPAPVVTIALPTPALLNLAKQVFQILENQGIQKALKGEIEDYVASLNVAK